MSIQLRKSILHFGLLAVCAGTFLLACLGFILLEILIKPLVFGFILLCAAPLWIKEFFIKRNPA